MAKLLVILQNAYKAPRGFKPSMSNRCFLKSRTGSRLQRILPVGVDVYIINASPEIGNHATSNYSPQPDYVQNELDAVMPDVILACGNNAKKVINLLNLQVPVISMKHPASRTLTNTELYAVKNELSECFKR
jgi:hypothetical protein